MRADPEKARRWEQTVREQEASGLKAAAFCRDRGVAPALFYPWRRRLRGGTAGAPAAGAESAAGFVEMVTGAGGGGRGSGVALRLGEGLTVAVEPGFDGETLRRVVSALRGLAG
jgi:hypothetical protein